MIRMLWQLGQRLNKHLNILKIEKILFVILLTIGFFTSFTVFGKESDHNVKVGFFSSEGYHNYKDGVYSGYGYEYLEYLSRYLDWNLDYRSYDSTWQEAQEELESGAIDILTSAQKTPELLEKFDFSDKAIGKSSTILTIKAGNTKYVFNDYVSFKDMRIGGLRGNSQNTDFLKFAEENNINFNGDVDEITGTKTVKMYNTIDELKNALQNNEVDAIVTSNLRTIDNEWIVAEFNISPFYAIVKKGNQKLLAEVNYGINQIDINYPLLQEELFDKYYVQKSTNLGNLTIQERYFITSSVNKTFTGIIAPNISPVSYYKDGNPQGIIGDLAKEIVKRSGMNVIFLQPKTMTEYYDMLEKNSVDIVFDAKSDYDYTYEYKNTEDYLELNYNEITAKEEILNNKTVAALRNASVTQDYIEKKYDKSQIYYYDTINQVISAINEGWQDVCYLDEYTLMSISLNTKNRLVNLDYQVYTEEIAIAVSNTADYMLVSIFDKIVNTISSKDIDNAISANVNHELRNRGIINFIYENPFLAIILGMTGSILILMLFASLVYRRIKANNTAEIIRFASYACIGKEYVFEFDLQNMVRRQYNLEKGKLVVKTVNNIDISQMLGKINVNDIHRNRLVLNVENAKALITRGAKEHFEFRITEDGGKTYRWYEVILQSIVIDAKHPLNCMIYIQDINSRFLVEEEKREKLEDALEKAKVASRVKSDFLAKMSYKIRTPLNSIVGYMILAENSSNNQNKVMNCIERARISSEQLLTIINDILDMSSIEKGELGISHEIFDLKQLIINVSELFYSQSSVKGLNFETYVEKFEHDWLIGDYPKINQILYNLLSNAIKYTNQGKIYFKIIEELKNDDEVNVIFTIEDTGQGMTPEMIDKMFIPLEYDENGNNMRLDGTGLEMPISHSLIELIGGTIEVTSEQGKGTKVVVNIPLAIDHRRMNKEFPIQDFSEMRVLVIDDETTTCDYIGTLLNHFGIKNKVVNSGKEAILSIKESVETKKYYTACIMDLYISDISSYELIEAIKNNSSKRMPYIIATCYDFVTAEQQNKNSGINAFISKPLFKSSLYNALLPLINKDHRKSQDIVTNRHDFSGRRVLLVEDNLINLEITMEILKMTNLIVDTATDGIEAVEKFTNSEEGYYDVIFMDIELPKLNGYEATKQIRASKHPDASKIAIYAMTANAFQDDVKASFASGMDDHLTKPIDVKQVFMLLDKTFKNKKA